MFLNKWEASVDARSDVSKQMKEKMLLSKETRLGLRRTGIHCVLYTNNYSL